VGEPYGTGSACNAEEGGMPIREVQTGKPLLHSHARGKRKNISARRESRKGESDEETFFRTKRKSNLTQTHENSKGDGVLLPEGFRKPNSKRKEEALKRKKLGGGEAIVGVWIDRIVEKRG